MGIHHRKPIAGQHTPKCDFPPHTALEAALISASQQHAVCRPAILLSIPRDVAQHQSPRAGRQALVIAAPRAGLLKLTDRSASPYPARRLPDFRHLKIRRSVRVHRRRPANSAKSCGGTEPYAARPQEAGWGKWSSGEEMRRLLGHFAPSRMLCRTACRPEGPTTTRSG